MSVPLGTTQLPGRGQRRWSVTRTDGPSPHDVPVGSHFEDDYFHFENSLSEMGTSCYVNYVPFFMFFCLWF